MSPGCSESRNRNRSSGMIPCRWIKWDLLGLGDAGWWKMDQPLFLMAFPGAGSASLTLLDTEPGLAFGFLSW